MMNHDELIGLIRNGESETVEFKENFDKETIETAGAFANTKGGTILVGVSDKGKVIGVQLRKDTTNNWVNQITQSTDPRMMPEIEVHTLDGKNVAIILVKEFPIKPVSVKGKCFRRIGTSNRVMTPQEIAQIHLVSTGTSWDSFPAKNTSLGDIDVEKVKRYIKRANAAGRRKIDNNADPLQVLEKLELVKEGRPTIAAVILFGKNPQEKFRQATVHCGRFKKETIIIDDTMIRGNAIEQIEEVMDFIRKNTNVRFVITGKPQRDQIWEYPLDALREVVVNAICHRDYADNSDIQLKIHDDRFTIWNPGGLLPGLTIQELYNPNHVSKLRNNLIAQIFYDLEVIERYGTGIQRIIDACKHAGLPSPVFEERFGGFFVIFEKDKFTEEFLKEVGCNKRQIKAVMYVKEQGRITNNEYQQVNSVSRQTASRELTVLVNKSILIRVGTTGKSTYYKFSPRSNASETT